MTNIAASKPVTIITNGLVQQSHPRGTEVNRPAGLYGKYDWLPEYLQLKYTDTMAILMAMKIAMAMALVMAIVMAMAIAMAMAKAMAMARVIAMVMAMLSSKWNPPSLPPCQDETHTII